jgi:hypothetical protein
MNNGELHKCTKLLLAVSNYVDIRTLLQTMHLYVCVCVCVCAHVCECVNRIRSTMDMYVMILSRVTVTKDGVRMGKWIY